MKALYVKDREGRTINTIYGYADEGRYLKNPFFIGATCGRYAGRISEHGFHLGNVHYALESEGPVHLHGGPETLALKPWQLKESAQGEAPSITYTINSGHLEGGYPGDIQVEARYTLKANRLEMTYKAISDRDTHLNLTNHNYYNLNGGGSIADHRITVAASGRLETDHLKVPTGNILPLAETPYDLDNDKILGEVLQRTSIDDTYIFESGQGTARIYAPETGITMKLSSNQPGMVIFVPEAIDEGPFLNAKPLRFPAICFEPQHYPDAPNKPQFPTTLLRKGEVYENIITLEFSLD